MRERRAAGTGARLPREHAPTPGTNMQCSSIKAAVRPAGSGLQTWTHCGTTRWRGAGARLVVVRPGEAGELDVLQLVAQLAALPARRIHRHHVHRPPVRPAAAGQQQRTPAFRPAHKQEQHPPAPHLVPLELSSQPYAYTIILYVKCDTLQATNVQCIYKVTLTASSMLHELKQPLAY